MPWPIEYGRCPCGVAAFEDRDVEVHMSLPGNEVALNGVPQGACLSCGARVYKAAVLARLEALYKRAEVGAG